MKRKKGWRSLCTFKPLLLVVALLVYGSLIPLMFLYISDYVCANYNHHYNQNSPDNNNRINENVDMNYLDKESSLFEIEILYSSTSSSLFY